MIALRATRPAGLATLLVLLVGAFAAAPARAQSPALADSHGIHVVSAETIDPRQFNVQVASAALGRAVNVRILLPADYARSAKARYPVLYLFHGTSGRASDWVQMGDAEATTAGRRLIVVMPDAGFDGDGGGWFTDWFNDGRGGPPMWETFHIAQLLPWIDANLRTIHAREGRAIAGLSQGGFGALSYAARHPELFGSVASFSGAAEIDDDPQAIAASTPIIEYTASALDHASPDAMFGPRATQEANWKAHDPATLAANLRHTHIWLWTGNGAPGPLDHGTVNPPASGIESVVHEATQLFHGHLETLGIPSFYEDYGPGTHTWPYWARDLRELIGPLTQTLAPPTGVDPSSALPGSRRRTRLTGRIRCARGHLSATWLLPVTERRAAVEVRVDGRRHGVRHRGRRLHLLAGDLNPGRHRVTLRVAPARGAPSLLRSAPLYVRCR